MALLKKYFQKVGENERSSGVIAYLASLDYLFEKNAFIAQKIIDELQDQRKFLKLIASENYSSLAVQLAMGNLLTDKYAEGFPFHRFYAGCENVDEIENRAVELLKEIYGCDHAYVQPHSGADANLIAYWAILVHRIQNKELEKLGAKGVNGLSSEEYERIRQLMLNQKVMGMSLNSGGHLTHGYRMNVSAKFFEAVSYDVDERTHLLDYDVLQKRVLEEKPLILVAGYSAYSRLLNFAKLKEIADSVSATLMVDMAHFSGLLAGKVLTGEFDPVPYADVITSTTHKTLRGPRGGMILCKEEYREVINKGCPMVIGGPLPHVMAAKAVAFEEASDPSFQEYSAQIVANARALAETLCREKVHVLTGGTDNHLLVLDVDRSFGLNGLQAERVLRQGGITVNRNSIPFDKKSPWLSSGVRIGTPALTTLGMKEKEMEIVGQMIAELLRETKGGVKGEFEIDRKILDSANQKVGELLEQFPLYPELQKIEK